MSPRGRNLGLFKEAQHLLKGPGRHLGSGFLGAWQPLQGHSLCRGFCLRTSFSVSQHLPQASYLSQSGARFPEAHQLPVSHVKSAAFLL